MNNLKILLAQTNTTQKELANKIKVGQSTVSNWVSGRHEISDEMAIILADIFDVSPAYVKGLESDPKPIAEFHAHRNEYGRDKIAQSDIDLVENLKLLTDMYKAGDLSEDEFKAAKRRVLGL